MKKRFYLLWVCLWFGVHAKGQATSQPVQVIPQSDPLSSVIDFSIPGAKGPALSHAIVVLPKDYSANRAEPARGASESPSVLLRWPVVYLLHGYTGSYADWYLHTRETNRQLWQLATRYRVIIVLPDGKYSSWYVNASDHARDFADWQWETVITKCLVPEIDKRYRTWAQPAGRGITGLSMGGHGALYLAAHHPELFSVCGSMSGVTDLTAFPQKYDIAKRLGPYEQFPERWAQESVMTQCEKFPGHSMGIFVDCGRDDPFAEQNRSLHAKLLALKVPHDYIERPGGHSWDYWINALPYHLQFMTDRLRPAGNAATPSSRESS